MCVLQMTQTCRLESSLCTSASWVTGWCCGSDEHFLPHDHYVFLFFSSSIRKEMCVSISRSVLQFAGRNEKFPQKLGCTADSPASSTVQSFSQWFSSCRLSSVTQRNNLELIVPAVKGHRKTLDNQHIISINQTRMWNYGSLMAHLRSQSSFISRQRISDKSMCLFFCFAHSDPLILNGCCSEKLTPSDSRGNVEVAFHTCCCPQKPAFQPNRLKTTL